MKKRISTREFERRKEEILARMRLDAKPFEDDSEKAKAKRKERSRRDVIYFLQTYLPHYFDKEFAQFHKEWIALSQVEEEPVFIAAPREHGKSAILSLGVPMHDICFEIKHLVVIVSDTEDLASDFVAFIRLELEENERIKQDFGQLKGTSWRWGDYDLLTSNGVRVKARGRGQRIRGLRNRQYRPDRLVIDDLENDKNVRNPRLVKETIKWLLTAVLGSLAENYSLLMVGNIINKKSVLAQMIEAEDEDGKPKFISRVYKAIQDNGQPLWPDVWPLHRLEKRKRQQGSVFFNQEMMNDPKDEEGAFREGWIIYYHFNILTGKELFKVTFIDPSVGQGETNDYKAIITIGYEPDTALYHCLDAFIRRCSIDQMIRASYNRYEEFKPIFVGLETNGFQRLLLRDFDHEAKTRGYHLPIRQVNQITAKETRVLRLSPLTERGIVRFQKGQGDQGLLIEQLIYFPSSTVNDDGPDALEGAISLCEVSSQKMEYHGVQRRKMVLKGAY